MGECNLECTEEGFKVTKKFLKDIGDIHQFLGNVKVKLVEPDPRAYTKDTWAAACISMAYFAMGAAVFPVLIFTINFKDYDFFNMLHIYLCTLGFQLFIPSAYLTLNHRNPTSKLMKTRHKKFECICLKACGFVCIGFGGFCAVGSSLGTGGFELVYTSVHAMTGILATLLCSMDVLQTFFLFCLSTENIIVRLGLVAGLPSFIVSGICFCLGISHITFRTWVPCKHMVGYIIFYCVFYTVIVVQDPLRNLFFKE